MFRIIAISLILGACTSQEVKVLEDKEQTIGMKAYKICEEAPKYLIFPKPYPIFTMKGVKFPVRIIGLKNGKVVYEKIHYPEEHPIKLPEPDLVIETPVCKEEEK